MASDDISEKTHLLNNQSLSDNGKWRYGNKKIGIYILFKNYRIDIDYKII